MERINQTAEKSKIFKPDLGQGIFVAQLLYTGYSRTSTQQKYKKKKHEH